jgi:hypothetical protein
MVLGVDSVGLYYNLFSCGAVCIELVRTGWEWGENFCLQSHLCSKSRDKL